MTKTIGVTAALLTMCVGIVLAGKPFQKERVDSGRLDSRIGPAKPRLYKSMIDMQDWRNPYLRIRREGVELIAEGLPGGRTVSVRDLERTLIELPVTAWPYGAVAGVVDISIREPDGSDE